MDIVIYDQQALNQDLYDFTYNAYRHKTREKYIHSTPTNRPNAVIITYVYNTLLDVYHVLCYTISAKHKINESSTGLYTMLC